MDTACAAVAAGCGCIELRLDEKPAASLYGFLYAGIFYFYQSGFDDAYKQASVGLITMGLAIQSAIKEGAEEYDLLHGDESYKSHWCRHSRDLVRLESFPRAFSEQSAVYPLNWGGLPGGSAAGNRERTGCMIRTSIKTAVASALYRTGIDRAVGALSGARHTPLVIGYHRVVENFEESAQNPIPSASCSRDMLQRHLDWIGRRYRFVGLDELGVMLESGDAITEPVAAITFDDGYQDFYDHAVPVLQRKGVPAALFVVTGLVGTTQGQTPNRLYRLLSGRNGGTPLTVGLPIPKTSRA